MALLPGLAGAATYVVFLADWPAADGPAQFGIGVALGVAAWILVSLAFCQSQTRPESANPDIYGELCVRLTSLGARIEVVRARHLDNERDPEAYFQLAERHYNDLRAELNLAQDDLSGGRRSCSPSCLRWLLASGYVNAWRHVHRMEEALLEFEPPEALRVAAAADQARLKSSSIEGSDLLADRLGKLLGADEPDSERNLRVLLREARYALNKYRNDLWDQIVQLRNLLFATMVATGIVTYSVLAVAVVSQADQTAVTAAAVFYLVGAAVGLFGELYATSRRKSGIVNDYGLALVRLLTIPLLSGIAAVGGVLLTQVGATSNEGVPSLTEIFSLTNYPAGLVVAAIFGLSPGLLLERLRTQTEDYKKEIAKSGVAGEQRPAESLTS